MARTIPRSSLVAGAALFASLTVVLDIFFKYSAFKVPFPPAPFLKFDLDGLPVILSLLVFGPWAGAFSSISLLLTIGYRGPPFAVLKVLAEASTAAGVFIAWLLVKRMSGSRRPGGKALMIAALVLGVTTRALVMLWGNWALLPLFFGSSLEEYYRMALNAALGIIVGFNVVQGGVNVAAAMLVYLGIRKRLPGSIET
ncbi:MAG: ECF transporter S component [Nitrososphaeria archaeon]